MTTAERAARNSQIVHARLRGLGETEVAGRFGVTPRQVRRVLAEHREGRPRVDHIDPLEVVGDVLDGYEALAEELAELADRTRHDGVRLGAIKARLEAQKAKIELLQAAGVLPADLPQLRVLRDVSMVGEVIIDVFNRHGVSIEARREIRDLLDGRGRGWKPVAPTRSAGDDAPPEPASAAFASIAGAPATDIEHLVPVANGGDDFAGQLAALVRPLQLGSAVGAGRGVLPY